MEEVMEDWTKLIGQDDLKRAITLDHYINEQLRELSSHNNSPARLADARQRLQSFVQKIEGYAEPDDVWWEWVQGTEQLMQTGGLAVVRNGTIVWATMTWIS
jgi:hypothetical protein